MIREIQDLTKKILKDDASFDLTKWDGVINSASNVLVFHLESTLNYFAEYFKGYNISFILYENNQVVGIFPLFVHKEGKEEWKISADGVNLISPLFINGISKKTKKRLEKGIIEVVKEIAGNLKIKKIQLFDSSIELSTWYLLWLEKANKNFLTHQLAVNLEKSTNEIKLNFRKSYKPLVNKSLKEWDIEVCGHNIDNVFEEFRLLHLEVAGKETRSRESWNIQKEQVKNNEALLVTVMDGSILIGAGLFTYTKYMGSYSVGAYKRELFDKPIGHGVQMKAIKALKERGCQVYHIGQKMSFLDQNVPTEKELSISYFKEGFAGYVFARPHLEVNLSE